VVVSERFIVISGGYHPFSSPPDSNVAQDTTTTSSGGKTFFDDEYVLDTSTWSWHARRLPRISRFPISLCNLAHLYDDTDSSEFDGCVFRAAVKVPRSLLPHNIRDSSLDSEETAPSPDISDAVIFYGGLATNESKSRTFTSQLLDPVVLNTM
jgi:hypothetical protein